MTKPKPSLVERVLSKTTPRGECLIFTGDRTKLGYGQIEVSKRPRRRIYAHRIIAEHHFGPSGLEVRHSCDTPSCVAAAHLSYSTHAENQADIGRRQRTPSKLQRDQVLAIRSDRRSAYVIAAEYEVSPTTIYRIRHREAWRWLQG